MAGYTKNIAVIRGIKSGFSADGGALSGLVKVEKYGSFFRAEISFINFAPLVQGRYITAVTDGEKTVICEGTYCECQSDIDTSGGFAAAICFINGEVSPVAVAVCGDMAWAVPLAVREAEREEKNKDLPEAGAAYEDEAIAEDNYYEYGKNTQSEGDVRQNSGQKEGDIGRENEADIGLREKPENAKNGFAERSDIKGEPPAAEQNENAKTCRNNADSPADMPDSIKNEAVRDNLHTAEKVGENIGGANSDKNNAYKNNETAEDVAREIPLADDLGFYSRMRGEIEKLLSSHPRERALEQAVEGSRWVRITYGGKRYYVFGIISENGRPSYVCYGVPAMGTSCPESLKGMAGFIPAGSGGYWVMYQDAKTGASVKLSSC